MDSVRRQGRYALFIACADSVLLQHGSSGDVFLADLFTAFAHGIFPFAVYEEEETDRHQLWFRRTGVAATDKDRTLKLTNASRDLLSCGPVEEYNTQHPQTPLHVNAARLAVAWPIDGGLAPETHIAVVPCLLRWTQWDRMDGYDGPWAGLLRRLVVGHTTTPVVHNSSRTVRNSQVMDFVGNRCQAEGKTDAACLAAAQEAGRLFAAGRLLVTYDTSGRITSVAEAATGGQEEEEEEVSSRRGQR